MSRQEKIIIVAGVIISLLAGPAVGSRRVTYAVGIVLTILIGREFSRKTETENDRATVLGICLGIIGNLVVLLLANPGEE